MCVYILIVVQYYKNTKQPFRFWVKKPEFLYSAQKPNRFHDNFFLIFFVEQKSVALTSLQAPLASHFTAFAEKMI